MPDASSQFVGDIPHHYDTGLGPNIFVDYAVDTARRAAAFRPARVLELAAGTGIVSRKLRDALPEASTLTVTDLNAPMLDVARTKFAESEKVAFAVADAMQLDFPAQSFDLIVCQFGVMFFPDRRASFREALRVLTPGGAYLLGAWGTMDENPYARVAYDVGAHFCPDDPPAFYRVPFSCADAAPLIADLKGAGFSAVSHEVLKRKKRVDDISVFARGLVYGNPMIGEIAKRGLDPEEVVRTIEQRLAATLGPTQIMPRTAHLFTCLKG
ncbi:MAG TPA: class I SAM-dependent methyltransferase [Caulobacterales bacterium]|nr:class I SAM-dependent methyltransferase [Caulobacterales bacterium]